MGKAMLGMAVVLLAATMARADHDDEEACPLPYNGPCQADQSLMCIKGVITKCVNNDRISYKLSTGNATLGPCGAVWTCDSDDERESQ